ncbi:hypothetical protein [Scleromatobacter humisilvae]|uniref:Uncharacterized protein n=1 Tax=Scleromatobacter humisilvae TaxID=2897159 RepID=A0A9X1YPH1_9BURK|nr:hypothetical protein [Scleromatobacter humisilvae]MCK9689340.1 hypothetical protein [Scleromatobacter humisilvae]
MSKVLVEEPRWGRACARVVEGSRRLQRNRIDDDGEGGPTRLGMKRDGCKHFGEHLGPLYRYLSDQAGRPWDKVYGELCAALDRRSVVQAHLFQHIDSHVDRETVWRDDKVWVRSWRGLVPLSESRAEMYVHPRTGILLVNRARVIAKRRRKQADAAKAEASARERRIGAPLPPGVQWHRIDGLWYEVRLRALGRDGPEVFDVVLRRGVRSTDHQLLKERYGSSSIYAHAKRQLDGRTLRRHGLAQE